MKEVRKRLVAIVQHRYRDSFVEVVKAAGIIETTESDSASAEVAKRIENSVARIADDARNAVDLAGRLARVIEDLQAANSDQMIVSHIPIDGPVIYDTRRIEQLLTTLIYECDDIRGTDGSVMVRAWRTDRELMICVADGEPREKVRVY